jgi:hypothetical protein
MGTKVMVCCFSKLTCLFVASFESGFGSFILHNFEIVDFLLFEDGI